MQGAKKTAEIYDEGIIKRIVYTKVVGYQESEDNRRVKTFGIECSLDSEKDNGCFCLIEDLSTKESFIDKLIERLIRSRVCPVHIRDIIEDSLI